MGMTFLVDTSPHQFHLFLTAQPCLSLNVCMYRKNVMPDQCQCKLALFERCTKWRFSLQFENLPQPAWFSIHQSQGRLEQVHHSSPDEVMWAQLDVHVIPDGNQSAHTFIFYKQYETMPSSTGCGILDSHWCKLTQANTSHGLAHDQTVVFGPDNLRSLVGINQPVSI